MSKIVIVVEGGIIQEILGIPKGIVIEVRDYDVDGFDEEEISVDQQNAPCRITKWEGK